MSNKEIVYNNLANKINELSNVEREGDETLDALRKSALFYIDLIARVEKKKCEDMEYLDLINEYIEIVDEYFEELKKEIE